MKLFSATRRDYLPIPNTTAKQPSSSSHHKKKVSRKPRTSPPPSTHQRNEATTNNTTTTPKNYSNNQHTQQPIGVTTCHPPKSQHNQSNNLSNSNSNRTTTKITRSERKQPQCEVIIPMSSSSSSCSHQPSGKMSKSQQQHNENPFIFINHTRFSTKQRNKVLFVALSLSSIFFLILIPIAMINKNSINKSTSYTFDPHITSTQQSLSRYHGHFFTLSKEYQPQNIARTCTQNKRPLHCNCASNVHAVHLQATTIQNLACICSFTSNRPYNFGWSMNITCIPIT